MSKGTGYVNTGMMLKPLILIVTVINLQGCAVVCAVILPEQTAQDQRQGVDRVCVAAQVKW
jgi:uncharacterized protein YceK